jgi:hypothetical protein
MKRCTPHRPPPCALTPPTRPPHTPGAHAQTGMRRLPYCHLTVFVREIRPEDPFSATHLQRRRPRWKCGSVRM